MKDNEARAALAFLKERVEFLEESTRMHPKKMRVSRSPTSEYNYYQGCRRPAPALLRDIVWAILKHLNLRLEESEVKTTMGFVLKQKEMP